MSAGAWPHSHSHGDFERATATATHGPIASGTSDQTRTGPDYKIPRISVDATSSKCASNSLSLPPPPTAPTSTMSESTANINRFAPLRTFAIRAGGVVAQLRTSVPGTLRITYPSLGDRFRSRSEPPLNSDQDVEMGAPEPFRRARSEFTMIVPAIESDFNQPSFEDSEATVVESQPEPELESESQPWTMVNTQPVARSPSLAPTELVDPDIDDLKEKLGKQGIKVRDFAYPAPAKSVQPASAAASSLTSLSSSLPAPASAPAASPDTPVLDTQPATEIFNPIVGLAECDYRWSGMERTYPVQGRTMRRLLTLGWLSPEDLVRRWHPMDREELAAFDAMSLDKGGAGHYPWRAVPVKGGVPNGKKRKEMAQSVLGFWQFVDGLRWREEQRLKMQEEDAVKMQEAMKNRAEEWVIGAMINGVGVRPGRSKRNLDEREEFDGEGASADENGRAEAKRVRLSPQPSSQGQSQSQSQPQYHQYASQSQSQSELPWDSQSYHHLFSPPAKQYPAPLHSYNPEVYPEAASVIATSSQPREDVDPPRSNGKGKGRAVDREDTPPLDEDEEAAANAGEDGNLRGRGGLPKGASSVGALGLAANRLVHPKEKKAMQRALSRTQTFTQLIV